MTDSETGPGQQTTETLAWKSRRGRLALAATILGSGVAFLDGSVVSVALPRIEADLGGGLATLQWVFDGYLLTLGALVLVGGALGDLLGKRRVFIVGTVGFGIASLLCGLAPTANTLIAARMLQGVAAALLIPTSLAILNTVFAGEDRGRAIGAWSGLSGLFTAVGPFLGGVLVESSPSGWRWVFLINVPLVIGAVWLAKLGIPQLAGSRTNAPIWSQVDALGGVLAVIGLGLIVGPLIEVQRLGALLTAGLVILGAAVLVLFGLVERRRAVTKTPPPMVQLSLFRLRTFSVANLLTFVVYGALGGAFFLVTVALQVGMGYSAIAAGASGIPVTILLALFSSRVGALLPKVGARPLLTFGPICMAAGIALLAVMRPGQTYWLGVFPGFLLFAIGLVFVVAPVTATALADVGPSLSGAASGVNNAVARIASLVAIILLPLAGGMAASEATSLTTGVAFLDGYRTAMLVAAATCALGGAVAAFGFKSRDGRVAVELAPAA
ncbi:MAG: MFS transporter [Candidatus Nanopelagicales bacterium]